MKKLILTLGIFFAGVLCMNAQDAPTQDQQTTKMLDNITKVCSLTSDQATKATPAVKQFIASKEADKAKYAGDKAQLKTAMKADRQALVTNLKPVLSADQIQKLEDHWKQNAQNKSTTSPE
ncbi:MAG TPA: hypothetical protein VNZ45_15580 [Bacteroidia bacterium]|jgi:hypothetical protein|nr:hypothetical protein [Bacteroidia bacterium]